MAKEVFFSVCYGYTNPPETIRNLHTFSPAVLHGYCRHRVEGADYPAVVREDGHSVRGVYVTGLTDENMRKLDYFEGSEYERITVDVQLVGRDGEQDAMDESRTTSVYVFIAPEDLERGEWDFENFRQEKMAVWTRGDWMFQQGTHPRCVISLKQPRMTVIYTDPDDKAIVTSAS